MSGGLAYVALDDPHAPGSLEVAVPVTDHRDQMLAALSASDRHEPFAETVADSIVPHLFRAASAARAAPSLG
ncbi:MAG: hypothetical protein ACRDZO_24555 [Egibacteraceae bacterium]